MQLIEATILGIVQGLTEFLPVSSSAHLILIRDVLGWPLLDDPHWNTIFDICAHAGTLAALLAYFRTDVVRLVRAFFATFRHGIAGVTERRLAWIIVMGTIPAAAAGYFGEHAIESFFRQTPLLIASLLMVFGLILWLAERLGAQRRSLEQADWTDGILLGCAQALALMPGVSRSGVTMTTGLARGMTRESAARFSFLLSLPAIAGSGLFGVHQMAGALNGLPQGSMATFGVGFLAAAVSGYLCIRYFLRYLQRHPFAPFIIYRVALGAFMLVWFAAK